MSCPSCGIAVSEGAAECPGCGLIFEKWRQAQARRQQAADEAALALTVPGVPLAAPSSLWLPPLPPLAAALAVLPAAYFTWHFRAWMPLPQGWMTFEHWLFPLCFADLAFHEGGHIVFGIPGWQFLMVAGGTLMQLLIPIGCLVEMWKQKSSAGVLGTLFWLGESLVNVAWYAADAKQQVLILITGLSGREGSFHDWAYMLDRLGGIRGDAVGIGQTIFFLGCWTMAFAVLAGLVAWLRRSSALTDSDERPKLSA